MIFHDINIIALNIITYKYNKYVDCGYLAVLFLLLLDFVCLFVCLLQLLISQLKFLTQLCGSLSIFVSVIRCLNFI